MKFTILSLLFGIGFNASSQRADSMVSANFTIDSNSAPIYCFSNYSKDNRVYHRWGFYHTRDIKKGHLPFRENVPPAAKDGKMYLDYRDSLGLYWVCHEVTNFNGIKDTVCNKVWSRIELVTILPNVFTPDSKDSGARTIFTIDGLENIDTFNVTIYNRWGAKVFEAKDKANGWNGRMNNNGNNCPDDTYYYIVKYKLKGNDKDEPILNGTITLIR